jgi:glycerol-3-phosphate acyltransferase PlsY
MSILCYIITALVAYALGSLNFAVIISKVKYHDDIRKYGSGNAGMTNMLRTYGKKMAAMTFFGDFFKAVIAVLIGICVMGGLGGYAAAFFCMVGHSFPCFYGFKGGKGVATMVGAVMGINPPVVLLCFATWMVVFIVSHYVSLASMIAGCSFPVLVMISQSTRWMRTEDVSMTYIIFSFVVAVLLIWTHRKNIDRLKNGTESKIYIWQKPDESAAGPKCECNCTETTEQTDNTQE